MILLEKGISGIICVAICERLAIKNKEKNKCYSIQIKTQNIVTTQTM